VNIQPLPALLLASNFLIGLHGATRGNHQRYVDGTLASIEGNTEGTYPTADEKDFTFHYKRVVLTIPYERMNSLEYVQKAGRRTGLAIDVTLVALPLKKRNHCITVDRLEENDKQQAAVSELSRGVVRVTLASSEARSARAGHSRQPFPYDP